MKKIMTIILIICLMFSCKKNTWEINNPVCELNEPINLNHQKSEQFSQVMDFYTSKGIPGIAIAIYDSNGYWAGASGYSKIETKTLMKPCNLQYSQSVSKTYLAVEILQLWEEGKINLDEKITKYLPENIISKVTGAENMTVRMLLNHTSGVAEYNDDPEYISYLLQHPFYSFTTMDYLNYIDGKPVKFEAGSKYLYTNMNYELLALIADEITGSHSKYMNDSIFEKSGLYNTFYHNDENYLDKPALVNSYWDRYSNGKIENCSKMQKINVASMIGDDGMIATPLDYVNFLKALFEGQLLNEASFEQMMTFVRNDTANVYGYGLGIHIEDYKGFVNYGHSGGGIGSGCYLGYFPHNNTYYFIAINIGTSVYSPIFADAEKMIDDLFDILIE